MNEDQYETSTTFLKRAFKDEKVVYHWAFVASGADGLPVFLVDKVGEKVRKLAKELRQEAKDKREAGGELKRDGAGQLVLALQRGAVRAPQLQRLLQTEVSVDPGFKAVKAILRNLPVVEEAETKSTSTGEEPTSKPVSQGPDPLAEALERIRRNAQKVLDAPAGIDDDKLKGLLERIEAYRTGGGTEDLTALVASVRGELAAREEARKVEPELVDVAMRLQAIERELDRGVTDGGRMHADLKAIAAELGGYREAVSKALEGR